jgi:hypothetical protein
MISGDSILVSLVRLVDSLPFPPPPVPRKRGRQPTYSDQLLVKALVVMIIRRLYTAWALLAKTEFPMVWLPTTGLLSVRVLASHTTYSAMEKPWCAVDSE